MPVVDPSRPLFPARFVALASLAAAVAVPGSRAAEATDPPEDLVLDVRVFEARSVQPDFQTMQELSFFIDSDGSKVSEPQWLATIAREVPGSFLATLAFDSREVQEDTTLFTHEKRIRKLELRVDFSGFGREGAFPADLHGRLLRGDAELRSFSRPIELRLGQTYVLSSSDLELSASDYLSHFRDYEDREHRGRLYDRLRDFTVFLILALTPRLAEAGDATEPVRLELPRETKLPELESPIPVVLVGTVELEFLVDETGAPTRVRVLRSSVPEVNPRLVGEAPTWRFEEAAGKRGRIELDVRAEP